jgi:hypothetical protein
MPEIADRMTACLAIGFVFDGRAESVQVRD